MTDRRKPPPKPEPQAPGFPGADKLGGAAGGVFQDRDAPISGPAGSDDLISMDEVLNTANLNDRMEKARLRHAQILALRRTANRASPSMPDAQNIRQNVTGF